MEGLKMFGGKMRKPMKSLMVAFTAVMMSPAALPAHAQPESHYKQSENVKTLSYVLNPEDDSYNIAWKVMQDIFENTTYNLSLKFAEHPLMLLAKIDLNKDGVEDFIAVPLEKNEYDEGAFCAAGGTLCPHYIFTGTLENPVLLGKIYANAIDVGGKVENGYETLKVFTREDEGKIFPERFDFYEIYQYNPETKTYVNAGVLPNQKPSDNVIK